MAHTHSAIKHLRQTKKRTAKAVLVKKQIAYLRKTALKAAAGNDSAKAAEFSRHLQKVIDKAAQRNIVKKNTARRKKSRLAAAIQRIKV